MNQRQTMAAQPAHRPDILLRLPLRVGRHGGSKRNSNVKPYALADEEGSEKSDDSSWFYSASQQEKSQAALADVRARDDYNRADVMQPSRIPIQQQQAVRDYFINIHEGNNK
jgi:hypothetical protein